MFSSYSVLHLSTPLQGRFNVCEQGPYLNSLALAKKASPLLQLCLHHFLSK